MRDGVLSKSTRTRLKQAYETLVKDLPEDQSEGDCSTSPPSTPGSRTVTEPEPNRDNLAKTACHEARIVHSLQPLVGLGKLPFDNNQSENPNDVCSL
jgi:hypothetical protein